MKVRDALKFIYDQQRKLTLLCGTLSLLDWDQKTYMPHKATVDRSLQISLLAKQIHEILVSDKLWNALEFLSEDRQMEKLSESDRIVVGRFKKDVEKIRKIPPEFIDRLKREEALSYSAWERARKKSKFDILLPHLRRIIELKKEYCRYKDIGGHIYNNLLDDYEEGMSYERIKSTFHFLRKRLSSMLDDLVDEEDKEIDIRLSNKKQERLSRMVIKLLGLRRDSFRMDESAHPFTVRLSTFDVRITTRYQKEKPLSSLFSTLHEAGHALYELNMPKGRFRDTVIADAPSFGLHESQSRFWENIIGRSYSFWSFFYPILRRIEARIDVDMEDIYRYVNTVKRSLVRTDADEVSYNLHIILRFEIEVDLFEGKIGVEDLPEVWNEKMEELIGIIPKTDREGVLQDMHWSTGDFGYFPSYTIGNIYAAQQFFAIKKEIGDFDGLVGNGDFKPIRNWLRENIHRYGRIFTAEEIMEKSCGEGLNPEIFIHYLEEKFSL